MARIGRAGKPVLHLLGLAAAAVCTPSGIGAQEVLEVGSLPSCGQCRLELQHVLTLDPRGPEGLLVGEPASVARTPDGRLLVTQHQSPHELLVFDSAGGYHATVGRRGSGPGEYRGLEHVSLAENGEAVLVDNTNGRITWLSTDLEVTRTERSPAPLVHRLMQVGPDRFIANASMAQGTGLPLHSIDLESGQVRSFGTVLPVPRPGLPWANLRALALAGNGRVWSAYRTQYVLELWDTAGALVKTLARRTSWFQPYVERRVGSGEPAQPWLMAIRENLEGQLLSLVTVPIDDYRRVLGPPRETPRGPRYDVSRKDQLFDTIVEVIDPETGELVASERLPQYLLDFLDDQHVYGYRLSPDGNPLIDVWRLRLVGP